MLTPGSLNGLPPDTCFPALSDIEQTVDDLCKIIATYDVQDIFQLQLMHRHSEIPADHVLLSRRLKECYGYWSAPIQTACVDWNHVRGSSYCLDSSGNFSPTEFQAGLPDRTLQVNPQFLDAFREYIQTNNLGTNNLGTRFGLQVLGESDEKMIEFSYDIGNILLPERAVTMKTQAPNVQFRTTAWTVTRNGDLVDHDGKTDCVVVLGRHGQVTKLENVSEVLNSLRDEGFLHDV